MAPPANVDTPKGPYSMVFSEGEDPNRKAWFFVKQLGRGAEGVAQLVFAPDGDQIAVRKVYRPPVESEKPPTDPVGEVRIANLIDSLPLPKAGFTNPLTVPLYATNDQGYTYKGKNYYARDSYWMYCNGGSFHSWFFAAPIGLLVHPPYQFIGRYLRQLYSTVKTLQYAGPKPINHWDLHYKNVYFHWEDGEDLPDAYIADFGWANDGPPLNPGASRTDVENIKSHIELLVKIAPESQKRGSQRHNLLTALYKAAQNAKKIDRAFFDKMIRLATALEAKCGAGKPLDETGRKYYKRFARKGRERAETSTMDYVMKTMFRSPKSLSAKEVKRKYNDHQDEDFDTIHGPWMLATTDTVLYDLGWGGIPALTPSKGEDMSGGDGDEDAGYERLMGDEFEDDFDEDDFDEDDWDDDEGGGRRAKTSRRNADVYDSDNYDNDGFMIDGYGWYEGCDGEREGAKSKDKASTSKHNGFDPEDDDDYPDNDDYPDDEDDFEDVPKKGKSKTVAYDGTVIKSEDEEELPEAPKSKGKVTPQTVAYDGTKIKSEPRDKPILNPSVLDVDNPADDDDFEGMPESFFITHRAVKNILAQDAAKRKGKQPTPGGDSDGSEGHRSPGKKARGASADVGPPYKRVKGASGAGSSAQVQKKGKMVDAGTQTHGVAHDAFGERLPRAGPSRATPVPKAGPSKVTKNSKKAAPATPKHKTPRTPRPPATGLRRSARIARKTKP